MTVKVHCLVTVKVHSLVTVKVHSPATVKVHSPVTVKVHWLASGIVFVSSFSLINHKLYSVKLCVIFILALSKVKSAMKF